MTTTARVSRITGKSLFLEKDNVAYILDMIRSGGRIKIERDQLALWYDNFMVKNNIEASKIEDVQIWADFVTEGFIREWRGRHCVSSEDVPYMPFDDPERMAEMPKNEKLIERPKERGGRFPKFHIPSAVEDGVGADGRPVIHEEYQPIRIFQPLTKNGGFNDGWRFGKKNPIVAKRIAGHHGFLVDKDDLGSLYDWEKINRKHTPYPMEQFFTRD